MSYLAACGDGFVNGADQCDDGAMVAQLRNSDGSCWSASFSAPAAHNDAQMFSDTSD